MFRYARFQNLNYFEIAALRLSDEVGLAQHFHDEVQVSFVLTGRRSFIAADRQIDVGAGSFCVFPPHVPHQAIGSLPDTICLNLYLFGDRSLPVATKAFETPPDLARITAWLDGDAPVACLASQTCMSREGATRRFSRRHGMPPQAFRRMLRLNRARRLLRTGMRIVDVAAETGFADQSHLGRWFRQAFGTTPARYQVG